MVDYHAAESCQTRCVTVYTKSNPARKALFSQRFSGVAINQLLLIIGICLLSEPGTGEV
jgi:hypothetical protein